MAYEQQFLTARKNYVTKIKDMAPSKLLNTFIEEHKTQGLAQELDKINGKASAEMEKALKLYIAYHPIYIKKLETQITKETQASKLKNALPSFAEALKQIEVGFKKDFETKKKAESEVVAPKPGAVDGKAASANAAADFAVRRNLPKIALEFKNRREKHLAAAGKVEVAAKEARKQLAGLLQTMQKEVPQCVTYMQTGKTREAAGLKIAALGQLNKIKNTAAASKKTYDDTMSPFFKDRDLKPFQVAEEMGLDVPKGYEKELLAMANNTAKIFTSATALTATAKRINEECASLVEDAQELHQQISDIADNKGFEQIFLNGATKAAERIKKLVETAMVDATKLKTNTIPRLASSCTVLEKQEPEKEISGAQAYVNTITSFLKTTVADLAEAEENIRQIIDSERKKVPAEILKGATGQVLAGAQILFANLIKTNKENSLTSSEVLVRAEKLVNV
jgi:hypothetical protein